MPISHRICPQNAASFRDCVPDVVGDSEDDVRLTLANGMRQAAGSFATIPSIQIRLRD